MNPAEENKKVERMTGPANQVSQLAADMEQFMSKFNDPNLPEGFNPTDITEMTLLDINGKKVTIDLTKEAKMNPPERETKIERGNKKVEDMEQKYYRDDFIDDIDDDFIDDIDDDF